MVKKRKINMNKKMRWVSYHIWLYIKGQRGLHPYLINKAFLDFSPKISNNFGATKELIDLSYIENNKRMWYKNINDSFYIQGYEPSYVYRRNREYFFRVVNYCSNCPGIALCDPDYEIESLETVKEIKNNKYIKRCEYLANNMELFYPRYAMCRSNYIHLLMYELGKFSPQDITKEMMDILRASYIEEYNLNKLLKYKSAFYRYTFISQHINDTKDLFGNYRINIVNIEDIAFYKQLHDVAYLNNSNPYYYYKNYDNYLRELEDYYNGSPMYNSIWNNYEKF